MNPEDNNNIPTTPETQQPSPQYGSSPAGSPAPKNNKTALWISVIVAVLIIIGVVVFFMNRSGDKKEDNNKTATTSSDSKSGSSNNNGASTNSKFEKYDVKDPLGDYSVSFYKGATTLDKNSLHYLISGSEGSQTSAYISLGSGTEIDCQGAPSTMMNVSGQSIKVCYQPDGKVYSGQLAVKGIATRVYVAGQKSVSMEDAKAIIESFSFK